MPDEIKQHAVGDAADPQTMETDLNGARTAVGVPHPENRGGRPHLPSADELPDIELDDYDDDKQRPPLAGAFPPDQDAGESFDELGDLGTVPLSRPVSRHVAGDAENQPDMTPTIDNQVNQPERFHNPGRKGNS